MTRHQGKFVSYLRVSTERQGQSGLGLEAQRASVEAWLNGGNWQVIEEVVEVESGRTHSNRPGLARACEAARRYGAKLIISRLDRLSRDPIFLLGLRDAGVDFMAVDMPHANRLTIGIMALVAEQEREAISTRTKAALAAAKARGTKLGNPRPETGFFNNKAAAAAAAQKAGSAMRESADAFAKLVQPAFEDLAGESANKAAQELNRHGVRTARDGQWTARAVINVRARLKASMRTSDPVGDLVSSDQVFRARAETPQAIDAAIFHTIRGPAGRSSFSTRREEKYEAVNIARLLGPLRTAAAMTR